MGIGQSIKIELASLPNFSLPNDIAPTGRFYAEDIVDPPVMLNREGTFIVGTEYLPNDKRIAKYTVRRVTL